MIKSLVILFSLLSTLFIDYIYTNEANIYAKFPTEVEAGKDFEIEITIEKGNLSDFGRFTQQLPEGFSAKSTDKFFEFKNQRVKLLWISLPASNTFSFKYTISVPPTFTGEFPINGQFSYIVDNEKKMVELAAQSITAKPSGTVINTKASVASSGTEKVTPQNNIQCHRQFFTDANGTIVKLKLKKEQLNNMAKVIETIPAGYTATAIETQQSIFSFSDNTVKFLWMNIPKEEEFVISYRLTSATKTPIDKSKVNGEFSYSINNLTYSAKIENKDFETIEVAQVKTLVEETNLKSTTKQTPKIETVQINESQVNFKIQIAAGHRLVNAKNYFKKFKIEDNVSVIQHEGWHKYTIKNFRDYKAARDYREKIWASTPVADAFVAAYNNGVRITIQEALMISNQKWYK